MTERLFSYGTLQLPALQQRLFGRTLSGAADTLHGFATVEIATRDPRAVAASGVVRHLALVSDAAGAPIAGMLYAVTPAELASADDYEGADYRRVAATFASGREGWVYVGA